jgi:hypothetical protein
MIRLFLLVDIILILAVLSCDNKDEETNPDQFPGWLQTKIVELTSEFDLCEITDVTIIEYNGKTYYHVYCGLWSCMYCHLFDEKGNSPNWESSQWNDFFAHKKEIKTVPACP